MTIINPPHFARPRGFSHGVVASGGVLFVAGQIGWNAQGEIVGDRFVDQFDQALANVVAVVAEAGGVPESVGRLTIYVTDKAEYRGAQRVVTHRRAISVTTILRAIKSAISCSCIPSRLRNTREVSAPSPGAGEGATSSPH